MENKQNTTPATEQDPAVNKEVFNLRRSLTEEQKKVEILTRHCADLSKKLAAAEGVIDNRTEGDMFKVVNGNSSRVAAVKILAVRNHRKAKEERQALEKAARKNSIQLACFVLCGCLSLFSGAFNWVHPIVSGFLFCTSLVGLGWALNDCTYIFSRCSK